MDNTEDLTAPEVKENPFTVFKVISLINERDGIYLAGVLDPGATISNLQLDGDSYYRLLCAPFVGLRGKMKPFSKLSGTSKPKYYVISSVPFFANMSPVTHILSHAIFCDIATALFEQGVVESLTAASLETFENRIAYSLAIPAHKFSKDIKVNLPQSVIQYKEFANKISRMHYSYAKEIDILTGQKKKSLPELIDIYNSVRSIA